MQPVAERLAIAQRHVDSGRRIVARQQQLIDSQTAGGRSTVESEELLSAFQRSLAIFERDLTALENSAMRDLYRLNARCATSIA